MALVKGENLLLTLCPEVALYSSNKGGIFKSSPDSLLILYVKHDLSMSKRLEPLAFFRQSES